MAKTGVSVPLDGDTRARLDDLATKLNRPQSELAAMAISAFVAQQDWIRRQIEAAVADADRGAGGWVDHAAVMADLAEQVGAYE